jgi:oligopeptide/dipeptide ABC transporter ATP-binding protein
MSVRGLRVSFARRDGDVAAVRGVDLTLHEGGALGLVGESGSGKSTIAAALMNLVRPPGRVMGGRFAWRGEAITLGGIDALRGRDVAMVFQDPMTALDPLMPIGRQVAAAARLHRKETSRQAKDRAHALLAKVQVSDPATRMRQFPHELSGGMRQRVAIAAALAGGPALLIADEPTTALDVTIQASVLSLLRALQAELGLTLLLISHDLGVIAAACDDIAVLYAGLVVERGAAAAVLDTPAHPYTAALRQAADPAEDRLVGIPGQPPDLRRLPPGCAYAPRCARAVERCRVQAPPLKPVSAGHVAACWRPLS